MGVPGLFPLICKLWPQAIKHFKKGDYNRVIDYLYLDANGLLHQAAQTVYNYGAHERMMCEYNNLTEEAKQLKVYSLFFESIRLMTQIVRPQKALYIAIDGPAPQAKQNQQRQRRFVAAKERLKSNTSFDSNVITPGTPFMCKMNDYLLYSIRKEINNTDEWGKIKVYFSPPTVPGEGEHKLLDFIRDLPNEEKKKTHCLFGPDGDLIMLTLSAHIPKMYLLREDQYKDEFFHLLDMGAIRNNLPSYLGIPNNLPRDLNDSIDDFIFQGFFVGNDFLPRIQMFYRLEDGIGKMVSTYSKILRKKNYYLVVNGEFDFKSFYKFVSHLADEEEYYLSQQALVRVPKNEGPDVKFKDLTLMQNIIREDDTDFTLDFKGYRRDYYKKLDIQIGKSGSNEKIKDLCFSYIKTLIWIYKYYVHGLPSWRWAYEYHYAPLMYDLKWYLSLLLVKSESFDFEMGKSSLPFEQLLSVLPTSSAGLVPSLYRKLMTHKSSDLVKAGYYPETFKVDYEGKRKKYQGVVLLPFVDYGVVHECYLKMEDHAKIQYSRNKLGNNIVFWYDPKYKAKYESKMGNINTLHVRSEDIPPHRV